MYTGLFTFWDLGYLKNYRYAQNMYGISLLKGSRWKVIKANYEKSFLQPALVFT